MDDEASAQRGGSRDVADLPPVLRDALLAQRSPLVESARLIAESPLIKDTAAQQAQLVKKFSAIAMPDLILRADYLASVVARMDPLRETIARIHMQTGPLLEVAEAIRLIEGSQLRAVAEAVAVIQPRLDELTGLYAAIDARQAVATQLVSHLNSLANTALGGWRLTLDSALVVVPRSPRPLGWLGESALEVTGIATEFALDDADEPVSAGAKDGRWREGREQLTDELADWLDVACPKVVPKLHGAWHALGSNGPDAASQAANSGVEALDWTLRTLAPDTEISAWRVQAGEQKDDLDPKTGRPTRSLRVRFIVREQGLDAGGVAMVVGAVASVLKELQKVKHGGDPTKTVEAVRRGLLALENALLALMPA